jgi:flagellar biosynthesis protein FlhG
VGKSLLVANLGIQLARQGRQVTLVDCDLLGSTLHSYLGVAPRGGGLDEFLGGRASSLISLARDTSVPRLRLIAGPRGGGQAMPSAEALQSLVLRAHELQSDFALFDLPSGRHPFSLDVLALADCGVLVTTAEPGSLEGAFHVVEELGRRRLDGLADDIRRALGASGGSSGLDGGPAACLDRLAEIDAGLANRVASGLAELNLSFVVNQVRADVEAQSALNLRSLCRHYLGVELEFAGAVEYDLSAWQATRQRKSLSQKYPNASATRTIEQIATLLAARTDPETPSEKGWMRLSERTHYQILEVPPSASQRDLQRAYDRLQAVAESQVEQLGSAIHSERVQAVRGRIENAYRTLVFVEPRSGYDRALVAAGILRPEELRDLSLELNEPPPPSAAPPSSVPKHKSKRAAAPKKPRPNAVEKPEEEAAPPSTGAPLAYTGAVLGALRRERGLSLEAIGAITKVRITHLRCLEEERFGSLPAAIFLKGFVREYARCLKIDPERVWQDYRARYEEWKRGRSES